MRPVRGSPLSLPETRCHSPTPCKSRINNPELELSESCKKLVSDFLRKHTGKGEHTLILRPLHLDDDIVPVERALQAVNVSVSSRHTLQTTFLAEHVRGVRVQNEAQTQNLLCQSLAVYLHTLVPRVPARVRPRTYMTIHVIPTWSPLTVRALTAATIQPRCSNND